MDRRDGEFEVRQAAESIPGDGDILVATITTAISMSDAHYMPPDPAGITLESWSPA